MQARQAAIIFVMPESRATLIRASVISSAAAEGNFGNLNRNPALAPQRGEGSNSNFPSWDISIAILSAADVSSWYAHTLLERGHEIMFGPFGHVRTAVDTVIRDGIDGVLILTDDDENLKEIAARFIRETGRPVWRNLAEIPR
jgi:hypothetical protein